MDGGRECDASEGNRAVQREEADVQPAGGYAHMVLQLTRASLGTTPEAEGCIRVVDPEALELLRIEPRLL